MTKLIERKTKDIEFLKESALSVRGWGEDNLRITLFSPSSAALHLNFSCALILHHIALLHIKEFLI